MALDTYTNLKASVRNWSKRKDAADSLIDDFILLAEEEIYHNQAQPLRLTTMEARATASTSTSDRFLQLPDDFLQARRVKLNLSGGDCDVRFKAPDQMNIVSGSGVPKYFTVTSQIEFDRISDSAYTVEVQYYKKPTALSSSNETNTVITNYPSIYLYGSLWALWMFYREEELSEYYYGKFINAVAGANKGDKKGRYGPAPYIRIEGSTP